MSEYEWDRTTMAVVASALSGDSDGAVELLRPLPQSDVCHIAVRLSLIHTQDSGGDREEALSQWQQCILQHEAEYEGEGGE